MKKQNEFEVLFEKKYYGIVVSAVKVYVKKDNIFEKIVKKLKKQDCKNVKVEYTYPNQYDISFVCKSDDSSLIRCETELIELQEKNIIKIIRRPQ